MRGASQDAAPANAPIAKARKGKSRGRVAQAAATSRSCDERGAARNFPPLPAGRTCDSTVERERTAMAAASPVEEQMMQAFGFSYTPPATYEGL